MILRPQTLRRLTILFLAVCVLVATGAGLYYRNEHRKSVRLAEARRAGMAAFKSGDYRAALDSLKTYVARVKSDNDALYAYGVSRSRIEEPNGKQVIEAIGVFNLILQTDPNHTDARRNLLELYTRVGYNSEAIDLSDRVLHDHPDDPAALRARCMAFRGLKQYEKALAASERINEIDPGDLDQQLQTYALMLQLKRPPDQLLSRARKQQAQHPDDPRFMMLLAMAFGETGDLDAGKQWLRAAATQPAPDATFVRQMVAVLDKLKMYAESQALLDRVTAESRDPKILRVLVQRLWQNNQDQQVIEQLKDLDANASAADTGLLAYRALALFGSGRQDEARAIAAALGKRSTDGEALAWSAALIARFGTGEPRNQLSQYQAALVRTPDNPVIRYFVGEAYARMGETELAADAWMKAKELAPSWAAPYVETARALAAAGRTADALSVALAGRRAAPNQLAPTVTHAVIWNKSLEENPNPADSEKLLALVTEIQKAAPGEAETLPIYVNLLARGGRKDDAITAIRKRGKLDDFSLLRLIAVSRANKLGLEDELRSAMSGDHDTPRLALARAADLAASGKPADGLALLQNKAKSATTQPLEWQLAVTQFKESQHDPPAAAEWVALGDANPKDLAVQTAILKFADSARGDRDFIARTIDRLKALTGPEAQAWKLERAHWLLGGDGGKDAAEAVNILTDLRTQNPQARLMLASAYESVNNLAGASKELQEASNRDVGNAALALEVARLMQLQNRFAEARPYLDRAIASPDLSNELRNRIARMLTAQGDMARAAKLLESAHSDSDASARLMLAEIYRRQNRSADAQAIYAKLLAATPVEAESLRAAADFYAAQGKIADGEKLLDRLGEAKATPAAIELAKGNFAERYQGDDVARRHYLAATAQSADPAAWRALISFHLRGGRYNEARMAADDALHKIADNAQIQRLHSIALTFSELSSQIPPNVLAVLASAAGEDRAVNDFVNAAAPSPSTQPITAANFLPRLKETVARNPRSLALQSALVQWHLSHKDLDEAGKAAAAAMEAFPNDAESARVAAIVYRAAGKLDLASAAATRWRERAGEFAEQADAFLAEIRLTQGDAAGASKLLAPYAAQLVSSPQSNTPMLMTLLKSYVLSGREKDARAVMEPLLAKEKLWRSQWLDLAGNSIADAQLAADWIKHIAPLIPPAADEQFALADAWYRLALRTQLDGAIDSAGKILEPLAQSADASAATLLLRAAVADRAGDHKTAEDFYRRALQKNPDQPDAMNNLAYLVLIRDGDPAEALALMKKAIELSPRNSSYHDTLARVLAKAGDRNAAIATFQKALALDATNVDAMIGLAAALTEAGKRDAAADLMPQIDSLLRGRPPLSPPLRRELDTLRATMKASL